MQRSTIRIRQEDVERIRKLASEISVSQEKCIAIILQMVEVNVDAGKLELRKETLSEESISAELRKLLKRTDRIFRTVCPLSEKDADDPDLGLGLMDVYTDWKKHPEKYRSEDSQNEKKEEAKQE